MPAYYFPGDCDGSTRKRCFCRIDQSGISVLPSGRYVTPAGSGIRITHDPFGMAVSPDGKKAVTLHNGVLTILDLLSMDHIRIPSYDKRLALPFQKDLFRCSICP